MRSLTASRSLASDSSPSDLANSSSIVTVPGVSIDLAVTTNSASLPARFLFRVVLRERHLQGAGFAGADADQLILEAGNECVRSDQHGDIVAGAALERLAVDRAGKGDDDAIVLGRLLAFGFGA